MTKPTIAGFKMGDDSETPVSCPRKRASRLGRACWGPGFPASAGMTQRTSFLNDASH